MLKLKSRALLIFKPKQSTILQIILIITISMVCGITKNLLSNKPLNLFQKYDLPLIERKIRERKHSTVDNISQISAEGLIHLAENNLAIIIDARSNILFRKNHIPGAFNLRVSDLEKSKLGDISFLSRGKIIIIYSNNSLSNDSYILALKLIEKGFKSIFLYDGGIEDWLKNDYPVEDSPLH